MSPKLADYPHPPSVNRTSASARGWGNGWPKCQQDRLVTISRDDGLRIPVHEAISQLVTLLIDESERRGYDVKDGYTWGYVLLGGWYQSIKDPMHYEFLGTRDGARASTERAKQELGQGEPKPYP